jgi:RNA-binding protein
VHDGLSAAIIIAALEEAIKTHDLMKVKFTDFKGQKEELAPQFAEKTWSEFIMCVGNLAGLSRAKPAEEQSNGEIGD